MWVSVVLPSKFAYLYLLDLLITTEEIELALILDLIFLCLVLLPDEPKKGKKGKGKRKRTLAFLYRKGGRKSIASELSAARKIAMTRANYQCQITGSKKKLIGHHLFDVSTYPQWAASPWNFFILTSELHDRFHKWMGGTAKRCTIFHFWIWRYFVCQWWKGCGFVLLVACVLKTAL